MEEKIDLRESIIKATSELIQENLGDVSKITSRKISAKAGVGLGLINYYFGGKENLITECVQRIINNVVGCFKPKDKNYSSNPIDADKERLTDWATQVFEFLYKNRAISTISILDDMRNYTENCNSVRTQKGFMNAIQSEIDETRKSRMVFMLTCSMQVAFLSGAESKKITGFDLEKKLGREKYIKSLVEILFEGC